MSLATLDPPRTSPEFLKRWTAAAEAVVGRAAQRKEEVKEGSSKHRHLLVLRFALSNLAAFALAAAATAQGWVGAVVLGDSSGLTAAILGIFLLGFALASWRIWEVSKALDAAEDGTKSGVSWIRRYVNDTASRDAGARSISGATLQSRIAGRIGLVRHIANSLVLLGLIGTVMGFIIALSGISAETVADPNAVGPMVGSLLSGMATALYTTLAGSVLNLWLMMNFHMLVGGSARLAERVIDATEDAARERASC